MASSSSRECAHARALYEAHLYVAAEAEYKSLLGRADCAAGELSLHGRSLAEGQLRTAERLQSAGFEREATAIVKTVVEGPTGVPVPRGLREATQRLGWWSRARGTIGPPLYTAGEIIVWSLAVLAGALILVTALRSARLRISLSTRMLGFSGSADATLDAALSASLGSAIRDMNDEAASRSIHLQSGTEPKFELPDAILKEVPQAGLVAGLVEMLDKLLYRRMCLVSGTVHPIHQVRGAGLTVTLTDRRGRNADQVTIWEKDFLLDDVAAGSQDSARYERLVLPAAIWLGYRRALGFDAAKPPLGTRDWRSYALFALGKLTSGRRARLMYEMALDRDPGNLGARLNLATLLLQRPATEVPPAHVVPDGSRETWPQMREMASELLAVVIDRTHDGQPIFYRTLYMQAVADLYDSRADGALEHLTKLRRACQSNEKRRQLANLIGALADPIVILAAMAQLQQDPTNIPKPTLSGEWISSASLYDWACLMSQISTRSTDVRYVHDALAALRQAIARDASLREKASTDPDFDPIREYSGFMTLTAPLVSRPDTPRPAEYALTLDVGPQLNAQLDKLHTD